jgi:hypothetical protein
MPIEYVRIGPRETTKIVLRSIREQSPEHDKNQSDHSEALAKISE